MKCFVSCVALALATAPAHAQTLTWEHVGDRAFGASRPTIAADGAMWSTGYDGTLTLPPPYGPGEAWTLRHEIYYNDSPILALGPDTLITRRNIGFYRSVDNGETFEPTSFPEGPGLIDALHVIPFGLPHGGTLLGEISGRFAIVSHDRGASWTTATIPNRDDEDPTAYGLAVVRHGPNAGRIVGGGSWGLATSDDGGDSYTPVPGRWQYFRYTAYAVGVLDRAAPGGGDRLVAAMIDPQRPGRICRVLVSDNGGDAWRETFDLTGDPNANAEEVVDFGGGRAVIVMGGGHVWQTTDAGESWAIISIVPLSLVDPASAGLGLNPRVYWALRGPDGRLYVGGSRLGGANPGWAFRTVAPVVAVEPPPDSAPGSMPGIALTVRPNPAGGRVEVVLELAEASDVHVVILDALGREVAVVLDGAAPHGEHVVGMDTASWPAGVYVVRATAAGSGGAQTATARLVVAQ